jgi:predicted nucleic acid-binding protein
VLAFLDTGAIYALGDRNDLDHVAVRNVYGEEGRRFVTHELILVEAFSLLTKRLYKRAALEMIGALRRSPKIEIVKVDSDLLSAAWSRCERFSDKDWD